MNSGEGFEKGSRTLPEGFQNGSATLPPPCTCDGLSPLCERCRALRRRIVAERLAELDGWRRTTPPARPQVAPLRLSNRPERSHRCR